MNPDLNSLQPYPFEKLAKLKAGCVPPPGLEPIPLSIGEPGHHAPAIAVRALQEGLERDMLCSYPLTRGTIALRHSIVRWLGRRFRLPEHALDADRHVLPVNGTREALFALAQSCIDRTRDAVVMMPNPFYQIYEGAALLAGATPYYYPTTPDTGYLPDFDAVPADTWRRCQLLYICTPGNPAGAVMSIDLLQKLIRLSVEYDFIIASDECYSEIYFDEAAPPPGLLQAAAAMGHDDFRNCIVFHSLSKRSNLPGMRSGFVAGDAQVIAAFLRYRTYHGCAMPPAHQHASIAAWDDEAHVVANRELYREKFRAVLDILAPVSEARAPDAGFYLWLKTPIADTDFARQLFDQQNVTVLPGSYLSRTIDGENPGAGHVRMALVAPVDECVEAARRIKTFLQNLTPGETHE